MTTKLQGRHAFLQTLRSEGVRYIFGNPGTSEAPMMSVIHEYPDLEYLMVVQEGVAIGMAEGYARRTGEVGFVSLHIDNGLANGFSLMIDQKKTGSPVVITAGNKDIRHMAAGRSDLADMAVPFAKWSAEISHPEQVPSVMRRAFQEARTPPTGPVYSWRCPPTPSMTRPRSISRRRFPFTLTRFRSRGPSKKPRTFWQRRVTRCSCWGIASTPQAE